MPDWCPTLYVVKDNLKLLILLSPPILWFLFSNAVPEI